MTEGITLDKTSLMERLPELREVHLFDVLDSTNDLGKKLIADNPTFPAVIYSRQQTSGRGRSGKTWLSNDDSLTFSFLVNLADWNCQSRRLAASHAIDWGLAVATALNLLTQSKNKFKVKWPNDVLANEKKVAGILIESLATQPDQQVVGIGINVSSAPKSGTTESETTDLPKLQAISVLEATGKRLAHIDVIEAIWVQFERLQNTDESAWLERFDELDYLKNTSLTVQQGGQQLIGRYEGVRYSGELCIREGEKVVGIQSGSIVGIDF